MNLHDRIVYVDGLRGLLTFAVFFHHFLYCFAPGFITGGVSPAAVASGQFSIYYLVALTPLNFFINPDTAITFFFVLSGFVLSHSFFLKEDAVMLRNNALKRYLRLSLPILGSCLLIWLLHRLDLFYQRPIRLTDINSQWVSGLMPDSLNFWQVIKYSFLDVFRGDWRYNSVLWTMQTELLGSFLVFILLAVTGGTSPTKKLLLFALTFALFILFEKPLLAAFCAGVILACLQVVSAKYRACFSKRYVRLAVGLTGLYLATIPFITFEWTLKPTIYRFLYFENLDKYKDLLYVTGVSLLLAAIVNSGSAKRCLSNRPLALCGKLSFSFYLLHLPLLFVVSTRLYQFFSAYLFDSAAVPLTLIASAVLFTFASWLFYLLADRTALRISSRFTRFF